MAGLSTEATIRMIDSGALRNSPITRDNIKAAQYIWGTSAAFLMGKTTRRQPGAVDINIETITPIPPDILNNHGNVVISMEVMKVNTHNI